MELKTEHFCTLFDSHFLPMGLALHESMERHAGRYHLWILCIDDRVLENLRTLALPNVSLIPLGEMETPELRSVKTERSISEYCWTLTPFLFFAVLSRSETLRVTYLDADLFFFDDPRALLGELDESGKEVLITPHAFDPRYDTRDRHGEFCVQFVTFGRGNRSQEVLREWQRQCLEWCFARYEPGRFGDQKYLDRWPELHSDVVHVLTRTDRTLAPWNANFFSRGPLSPVFFHFHGLRIVSENRVLLYIRFHVGREGDGLYDLYIDSLRRAIDTMKKCSIAVRPIPMAREKLATLRYLKRWLCREIRFARL